VRRSLTVSSASSRGASPRVRTQRAGSGRTACNDDVIEPDDTAEPETVETPETDGNGGDGVRVDGDADGDGDGDSVEADGGTPPRGATGTFDRWRRQSALGAVGTGVARGLQAVFAPPVDEPVIVASVPGDPPDADDRVRVILDPDDPTKSVAIVPEPPREDAPD
jgi:hypothetical protein